MNVLQQGLLISLIGMGLVFAVIIFLWGVMSLMVRATTVKQHSEKADPSSDIMEPHVIPAMQVAEGQRRAAVAAIAVQLMLSACSSGPALTGSRESKPAVSPWQTAHRVRHQKWVKRRG